MSKANTNRIGCATINYGPAPIETADQQGTLHRLMRQKKQCADIIAKYLCGRLSLTDAERQFVSTAKKYIDKHSSPLPWAQASALNTVAGR